MGKVQALIYKNRQDFRDLTKFDSITKSGVYFINDLYDVFNTLNDEYIPPVYNDNRTYGLGQFISELITPKGPITKENFNDKNTKDTDLGKYLMGGKEFDTGTTVGYNFSTKGGYPSFLNSVNSGNSSYRFDKSNRDKYLFSSHLDFSYGGEDTYIKSKFNDFSGFQLEFSGFQLELGENDEGYTNEYGTLVTETGDIDTFTPEDYFSKLGILIVMGTEKFCIQKFINREYTFYRYRRNGKWGNWKHNIPTVTSINPYETKPIENVDNEYYRKVVYDELHILRRNDVIYHLYEDSEGKTRYLNGERFNITDVNYPIGYGSYSVSNVYLDTINPFAFWDYDDTQLFDKRTIVNRKGFLFHEKEVEKYIEDKKGTINAAFITKVQFDTATSVLLRKSKAIDFVLAGGDHIHSLHTGQYSSLNTDTNALYFLGTHANRLKVPLNEFFGFYTQYGETGERKNLLTMRIQDRSENATRVETVLGSSDRGLLFQVSNTDGLSINSKIGSAGINERFPRRFTHARLIQEASGSSLKADNRFGSSSYVGSAKTQKNKKWQYLYKSTDAEARTTFTIPSGVNEIYVYLKSNNAANYTKLPYTAHFTLEAKQLDLFEEFDFSGARYDNTKDILVGGPIHTSYNGATEELFGFLFYNPVNRLLYTGNFTANVYIDKIIGRVP